MGLRYGYSATVALVAARPPRRQERRRADTSVLLVAVDSGPRGVQFVAEVTSGAAELVVLGPGDGPPALLAEAGHGGRLRPGDHVALGEVDVVLARMLRRHEVELEPAPVLDVLVELLTGLDV